MIDTEELPPIELACSLRGYVYYKACLYCMKLLRTNLLTQADAYEIPLTAAVAGYVAGVRHERKRQRQKATTGKLPTPQNITGQELELLQALRMIGDADRKLIFKMAKYWQKEAQKKKEPADAATRQQACTE
mgnify:CR=1 FL=1